MHGRTEVVQDAREVRVGQRAGPTAERGLRLEYLHRQTGARADNGRRQAIGTTADDGDVHLTSRPH